MPTRPDKFPRWASVPGVDPIVGGSNVVEPTEQKKGEGWAREEKPPANIQNWLHKIANDWLQYLDFAEGSVLWGGISTGTDPNYLVEIPHPITAYFEGMTVAFIPNFTIGNTAQATINLKQTGGSFLGAKNVRNMADNNIGGSAGGFTFGGGIAAGSVCIATFYNDEWVVVSATPRVNDPTLTAKQIMEAATNLVTYPSPGDLINHPGMPKKWVIWTQTGGGVTIHENFGLDTPTPITVVGSGHLRLHFTSAPMASAWYRILGFTGTDDQFHLPIGEGLIWGVRGGTPPTTTLIDLYFKDRFGSTTRSSATYNCIQIFGKLP